MSPHLLHPAVDHSYARYPGVLSAAECDFLLAADGLSPAEKRRRYTGFGKEITERLAVVTGHANQELLGWQIPIDTFRFDVTRQPLGGTTDVHADDEDRAADPDAWQYPHRGLLMWLPLAAGYLGGDLVLHTYAGPITPPVAPGTALLFGTSLPYEITTVTGGQRWALVCRAYADHRLRRLR